MNFFLKSSKVVKFLRDACVINIVTILKYTSHHISAIQIIKIRNLSLYLFLNEMHLGLKHLYSDLSNGILPNIFFQFVSPCFLFLTHKMDAQNVQNHIWKNIWECTYREKFFSILSSHHRVQLQNKYLTISFSNLLQWDKNASFFY